MLVYTPQPAVYPTPMSRPSQPLFKRQKTRPDALRSSEFHSRSASPAGSFNDGLRPHDLPARGASPAGSFYSFSSTSSPSIASASSSGSRNELTLPSASSWLSRSPRSTTSPTIASPTALELASPPDTPMEVPEAELRRRQLEKATRILGEYVPLELVFQPRQPLVKSFPEPPPRRSTDSPQPGQQPREMLTERRAGKIVRRASLSLSTLTSKLRGASTNHSRDSSQESQSASSSDHSHQSRSPPSPPSSFTRSLPRRRSVVLTSPIIFAFPRSVRSPPRTQISPPSPSWPTTTDPDLVIDIRSPDSSEHGHEEDEATPVREHALRHVYSRSEVLPRVEPLRAHTPTHTYAGSEQLSSRPGTPFFDYSRPETPFFGRPTTPFTDLDAVEPAPAPTPANAYLSPGVSRKERGQGWSGEWNQSDMQAVIQKLRTLK
ncbi:hypothetical protein FB451DRAFT_1227725 [Mycena latifolia]|nr:hypothetical protein FB451DRAFT_1227725 [Mycena latifolia]